MRGSFNNKKRLALVLKMAIAISCGSLLASCGNAQNPNANQMASQLQQKASQLQAARGNQTNPTTGQPATAGTNPLSGQVWISNCLNNSSIGSDGATPVQSYEEAYMFEGTAWFAEYAFWDGTNCTGNSIQPTNFPNAFGAGYIQNMPTTIPQGGSGTLQLIAWDSTTSIGYSSTNDWGTALGLSSNIAYTMNTLPTNNTSGDLVIGDVVLGTPTSATLHLGVWNGNS